MPSYLKYSKGIPWMIATKVVKDSTVSLELHSPAFLPLTILDLNPILQTEQQR